MILMAATKIIINVIDSSDAASETIHGATLFPDAQYAVLYDPSPAEVRYPVRVGNGERAWRSFRYVSPLAVRGRAPTYLHSTVTVDPVRLMDEIYAHRDHRPIVYIHPDAPLVMPPLPSHYERLRRSREPAAYRPTAASIFQWKDMLAHEVLPHDNHLFGRGERARFEFYRAALDGLSNVVRLSTLSSMKSYSLRLSSVYEMADHPSGPDSGMRGAHKVLSTLPDRELSDATAYYVTRLRSTAKTDVRDFAHKVAAMASDDLCGDGNTAMQLPGRMVLVLTGVDEVTDDLFIFMDTIEAHPFFKKLRWPDETYIQDTSGVIRVVRSFRYGTAEA